MYTSSAAIFSPMLPTEETSSATGVVDSPIVCVGLVCSCRG